MAMALRLFAALLLAATQLQAQLPPMQGAPSPNSLLNDLRAIQFPPAGGQAPLGGGGGGAASGMGLGFGLGGTPPAQPQGFGGAMPQQGGFGGAMPQQGGFGAMPQQGGFGAMPQQGGFGAMPQQGGFGGAMPPQGIPSGFGGFGQPGASGVTSPPVAPMGGGQFGGMPSQQQQQPMGGGEAPEDMACTAGPHAAAWDAAKQRFRAVTAAPLGMVPREMLVGALEETMQDLKASRALSPDTADECGLGKLSLQLLSIATAEDPAGLMQIFSSVEQLASPVLTLLLDVPWGAVAQAGWPLFGLLAQLSLRKGSISDGINTEVIDGLADPATRTFYADLQTALGQDGAALEAVAQAFLQKETTAAGSALAPLTAMAAQAAGTPQLPVRAQMLGALQGAMKQVVGDAGELDVALSTQWPLWGLLHVGVDSLAAA